MRGSLAGLCLLAMTTMTMAQDAALPVGVGGTAGNACEARGKAAAPTDVRVGPGDDFEVYDHLKSGDTVFLCEQAKGWYGIVYGRADCGVSKPIAPRQAYIGACHTGWVPQKSLTASSE